MENDFEKFDLQNKGFLNHEEYKNLSYSHLIKPRKENDIGNVIFKHDLRTLEKEGAVKDYKEYFDLYCENGYITFGPLKRLSEKVGLEISDDDILEMINMGKNKGTGKLGYDEFVKIMELVK